MMRRIAVLFLLGCTFLVPTAAAQSAGAFSRLGFGAPGLAMSNALVADAFGLTSAYYNPALAPYVQRQNVEAAYTFLSLDRELQFLQFAVPMKPRAGVTVGLIHAGVSDIDGRDASGFHTEDYSIDEFSAFLAFGTRMGNRLSVGIAFRFYYADFLEDVDPARSIGLSLGLTGRITDHLFVGAALGDLLAQYEWDTSNAFGDAGRKTIDQFPLRFRIGAAYQILEGRGTITMEYESQVEYGQPDVRDVLIVGGTPQNVIRSSPDELRFHSSRVRIGGEFWLSDPFAVRLGFDRIGTDDLDGLAPSAGFTIAHELGQLGTQFDYALRRESYAAGLMHILSVRLNL